MSNDEVGLREDAEMNRVIDGLVFGCLRNEPNVVAARLVFLSAIRSSDADIDEQQALEVFDQETGRLALDQYGRVLAVPSVHLNGTARADLETQLSDAIEAVHAAGIALAKAAPHGRDYYTQKGDAIGAAMDQHAVRLEKLRSVATELETILSAVVDSRWSAAS
jgi:hypothetical protein